MNNTRIDPNTERDGPRLGAEIHARLAAIIEHSEDAILSKSLDGIVTSWNPSAERLFGYTAQEMIGHSINHIIPPDLQAEEATLLERLRLGQTVGHYETVRQAKSGRQIDISLTLSPIRDATGAIIGASSITRDITERKRLEVELQNAQRGLKAHAEQLEEAVAERTAQLNETILELQAFSYSLSHDMRAPLRTIRSFLQIVLEEEGQKLHSESRDYLARVMQSAERLDQLITDILAMSKVAEGKVELKPLDVESLLEEIIKCYPEFQAPRADIRIERPLPLVLGHGTSLTQCFSNLLGNAVKFIAPGVVPQVRVWGQPWGQEVRLWFEDNGIGINPALQPRLFGLFERLHEGLNYEGTGVGLAIVQKAVERMGGRVGVESQPGKGSRFWLQLRLA